MPAGRSVTFPRVVDLLRERVAQKGQRAVAREIGITLPAVQRYLAGNSEPTQSTLEKLSKYFGVSVAELRGDSELVKIVFDREGMKATFQRIATEISTPHDTIMQVGIAVILLLQQGATDQQIVDEVRGLAKQFSIEKATEIKGRVRVSNLHEKLSVNTQDIMDKLQKLMGDK